MAKWRPAKKSLEATELFLRCSWECGATSLTLSRRSSGVVKVVLGVLPQAAHV